MTKEEKREYDKQYRLDNKEKIKFNQEQWRLKNIEKRKEYRLNNKDKFKDYNKEYCKKYYLNNKENILEYQKQYALENKEKITEYRKEYCLNNKEDRLKKQNKYVKNKYNSNALFKLTLNIRSLIAMSFRNNNYTKTSKTYNILGCSFEDFKQHIEKQFINGMNWDNRNEWHLDHIYPVSLATDENHLIELNHYTNFQPLWAIDNLKKGNKVFV